MPRPQATAVLRRLDARPAGSRAGGTTGLGRVHRPARRRSARPGLRPVARPVPARPCSDRRDRTSAPDHNLSEQDRIAAATAPGRGRDPDQPARNEGGSRSLSADFNPYRYLASEGFLPGYSFPRLPLAAYIPGRRGLRTDGDYVQRPRFLAIREFGPKALIYHEGARYEVHRVQVPPEAAGERRDRAGAPLPRLRLPPRRRPRQRHVPDVQRDLLSPVRAAGAAHRLHPQRRQRITSDEEERRRAGYQIVTSYKFHEHGDRPGRLDADARDAAGTRPGDPVLRRRGAGPPDQPRPGCRRERATRTASGSTRSRAAG